MTDLDFKPHFAAVARSAQLTGMVRAYARVLRRMIAAGMTPDDPLFEAIYDEMMAADERFASMESDQCPPTIPSAS